MPLNEIAPGNYIELKKCLNKKDNEKKAPGGA
jgi:hypothetical protein